MSNIFYNYLVSLQEYEFKRIFKDSIGLKVSELLIRWNEINLQKELIISESDIKYESESNFTIKINDFVNLIGFYTKYREEFIINNITMIAAGDGSLKSGADIINCILILVRIPNPHRRVEDNKNIIEKLGITSFKMNIKNEIIENDIKYSLMISDKIGTWFSISRI